MKRNAGIALVLSLLLSACAVPQASSPVIEISRSDVAEFSVSTSEQPKPEFERVISVARGVADVIASLGYSRILVGKDIASQHSELSQVPNVTDVHVLNLEAALAVSPTHVFVDATSAAPGVIEQLRSAGIDVVEFEEIRTVDGVVPRISEIADLLGVTSAGDELIKQFSAGKRIEESQKRVAYLYLRGTASVYLLGGRGSGADSIIESAGLIDVGAEAGLAPFTPLTPEALISLRPDALIVMSKGLESVGGIPGLLELPGVAQTAVAQNSQVLAVEDSLLLNFGPEVFEIVELISAAAESWSAA